MSIQVMRGEKVKQKPPDWATRVAILYERASWKDKGDKLVCAWLQWLLHAVGTDVSS